MYSPEFFRIKEIKARYPLAEIEKAYELPKKEEQIGFEEGTPHYQLSVIQLNSAFVEITDRDYPVRGIISVMAIFTIFLMSWPLAAIMFDTLNRWESIEIANRPAKIETICFLLALTALAIACSMYGLLREFFCYTHLPIRLNRKNRNVYVWRRNGTVMSAAWDKIFFYVRCYKKTGVHMWDIVGHVLEDDHQTVKDSFTLSSYTSSDVIDLRLHWEYFRRYMEDGPA